MMFTIAKPLLRALFEATAVLRRIRGGIAGLLCVVALAGVCFAASPAEQFVNDNVQKGMSVLTNKSLSKDQRREQFKDQLMGLVDIRRIADYTLGQFRRGANPADIAAFEAAYKEYADAVYQTYFNRFSDQTLQVVGSTVLSGDETVVKTLLVDPTRKMLKKPMSVSFRISSVGGKFLITDISVEGVWLRQTQRDDFTGFLGQNGGDIKALVSVLKAKTRDELAHTK